MQQCRFSCKPCVNLCHVSSELAKLQSAAQQSLATWKEGLECECTQGTISPRLSSGADVAKNRAVATQAKWGAHKREGGLYWATYKVFTTPQSSMANCKAQCVQGGSTSPAVRPSQLKKHNWAITFATCFCPSHLLRLPHRSAAHRSAACAAVGCFPNTGQILLEDCNPFTTWPLTLTWYAGHCAACQEWSVQVQFCW